MEQLCACFLESALQIEKDYHCGSGKSCPSCGQKYLLASLAMEHGCLEQGAEWVFVKKVNNFPDTALEMDEYIQKNRPYFSRRADEREFHCFV
jgi:hypothetical protein